jgi:hypothetical protein
MTLLSKMRRRSARTFLATAILVAGCAAPERADVPSVRSADAALTPDQRCEGAFALFDRAVARAGVGDAETASLARITCAASFSNG